MKKFLNFVIAASVILGAGFAFPPFVRGVCTAAFTAASMVHFLGRIVRNRASGRRKAAGVSLFLALLVLGPLVVTGMARGVLGYSWWEFLEAASFCLSSGLLLSIYLVEFKEEQGKLGDRLAAAAQELEATRRDAATRVRPKPTRRN